MLKPVTANYAEVRLSQPPSTPPTPTTPQKPPLHSHATEKEWKGGGNEAAHQGLLAKNWQLYKSVNMAPHPEQTDHRTQDSWTHPSMPADLIAI